MRVPEEAVGEVPAVEEAVVRAAAGKDGLLQDIGWFFGDLFLTLFAREIFSYLNNKFYQLKN